MGCCRFTAPVIVAFYETTDAQFPRTKSDSWCGEHQEPEIKALTRAELNPINCEDSK
jgi:hypothetical protein